jgi:hypothetical protein
VASRKESLSAMLIEFVGAVSVARKKMKQEADGRDLRRIKVRVLVGQNRSLDMETLLGLAPPGRYHTCLSPVRDPNAVEHKQTSRQRSYAVYISVSEVPAYYPMGCYRFCVVSDTSVRALYEGDKALPVPWQLEAVDPVSTCPGSGAVGPHPFLNISLVMG